MKVPGKVTNHSTRFYNRARSDHKNSHLKYKTLLQVLVHFVFLLTKNDDSVFVRSIGPHGRRNGHQVVCEVVENINVLPMVEGIGSLRTCPLDKS